jgi:hypothetical protein
LKRLSIAFFVLVGVSLFLFSTGQKIAEQWDLFINFDLYKQIPLIVFVRDRILSGSFPLWNPYIATGRPLFAELVLGVLYPFNLVLLLPDVTRSTMLLQFIYVIFGAAGMLVYLQHVKLDWPMSVFGAALYGYFAIPETSHPCMAAAYSLLPFIIWLAHRLFDKPDFKGCVALAAALALCFLAGFAQYFYYICIILGVYVLSLAMFSWRDSGIKIIMCKLAFFVLVLVFALGLVAVQLLPTMELSSSSVREYTTHLKSSEDPLVVQTSLFGVRQYMRELPIKWGDYYFGAALLFMPFAFASRKFKIAVASISVALVYGILFVLSKYVPALALSGKIPLADSFQLHVRMLGLIHFMVTVLAAFGLSSLWERTPLKLWDFAKKKVDWFWLSAIGFMTGILILGCHGSIRFLTDWWQFVLAGALLILMGFTAHFLKSSSWTKASLSVAAAVAVLWSLSLDFGATPPSIVDPEFPDAYFAVILICGFLLLGLLIFSSRFSPGARQVITWIIALLILLDVVMHKDFSERLPERDKNIHNFYSAQSICYIKQQGGYDRVLLQFPKENSLAYIMSANAGAMFGFFYPNSYLPLALSRWKNYICFMKEGDRFAKKKTHESFYGIIDADMENLLLKQPQMLGIASVRYFCSPSPDNGLPPESKFVAWTPRDTGKKTGPGFYMFENKFSLPRAYLVNQYIATHSEEESLRSIRDHLSEIRNIVVIEYGQPSFPAANGASQPGQTRITRYEGNRVELAVDANEPSLLVLTDTYYPGWNAYVDGVKKPVWRANSLFRAVEVDRGPHTVVYKYQPASFFWGVSISLVTSFLMLAVLFVQKRRSV